MLPSINTTAKIQKKYTRVTESGKSVTSLQLSVGEKNKNGEYDNFYFDATFWGKSSDFVDSYFNDGDFIEVKGDLITTSYAKDGGTKVYKTEIKFPKASFPPRGNRDDSHSGGYQAPQQYQTQNSNSHEAPSQGQCRQPQHPTDQSHGNESSGQAGFPEMDMDSDLPF